MLRVRSFAARGRGLGAVLRGFGAMLLAGVLFLTSVWHEPVLRAGLMLFPGPADGDRLQRPLGAPRGALRLPPAGRGRASRCSPAGSLWCITQTGDTRAYASEFLPGMVIGGAGVGLVIPTLTGAGASSLPPERFATGAAVLTMGRQIGAALGVAVLVAVLGTRRTRRGDFHARVADHRRAARSRPGSRFAALGPPAARGRARGVAGRGRARERGCREHARAHASAGRTRPRRPRRGAWAAGLDYMRGHRGGHAPAAADRGDARLRDRRGRAGPRGRSR